MTQAFAGFNGKIYVSVDGGSNYYIIGETRDGTLTINRDPIDATSYDSDGWMENIQGLGSWEMSTESLYLYGDTGQTNIENALFGATNAFWQFLPFNLSGNKGYTGEGIVATIDIGEPVDDAVTSALTITGTGALTTYTAT